MLGSMFRAVTAIFFVAAGVAMAQQYDPGASATEIKLGQTVPFSGPVSVAGVVGHASLAYFDAVNKAGGINGRQIKLIALDDGYTPPKTVEATRRLVEDDNVLMMYGSVGTPTNAAVQKYLNVKKVPQLFITTGASRFRDPKAFPWTMAFMPGYVAEGRAMGRYVLEAVASPKIAVLYQNDDLGKDFRAGFRSVSATRRPPDRQRANLRSPDPTVDSQLIAARYQAPTCSTSRHKSRCGTDPQSTEARLEAAASCAASRAASGVLKPAGLEYAEGLISTAYAKDPFDRHGRTMRREIFWIGRKPI
jgi:ABC-type branched-subunit amino acid transport system substrate-binding protein